MHNNNTYVYQQIDLDFTLSADLLGGKLTAFNIYPHIITKMQVWAANTFDQLYTHPHTVMFSSPTSLG